MIKLSNSDIILSQKRWEAIYKADKLKNYVNDPIIASYKKFLDKYRKDFKKGIFLDLGCGIAYTSSLLAKEGVCVLGIDLSNEAILKSRALFKKNNLKGKFIQADLLQLPLKDHSIEFIYSCMSLEYVKDTQRAVKEAYRVLKKGGKCVVIVPVISLTTLTYHQLRGDIPNLPIIKQIFEWFHITLLKGKYMHYGYEQSFTASLLKTLFKKAGFTLNSVDYFDMHYPISFVPRIIRPYFQKVLKFRPFWPLMYIEVRKE